MLRSIADSLLICKQADHGPVVGGYLVEALGWRWILWVFAIAYGVCTLAAFAVLRDTYAPALLERKAKRLRRLTRND